MSKRLITVVTLCLTAILTACSILKNDDPEKDIRSFLQGFQADLASTDSASLAKFKVTQSRDALLSAIRILQNKEPLILCEANFADAALVIEEHDVKAEIPILFRVNIPDSRDTASFTLTMRLTKDEDGFKITQFDGEPFYQAYSNIKNRNEWEAGQILAIEERQGIYQRARELEQSFDSVIWFVNYKEANYFYVVRGTWVNYFLDNGQTKPDTTARMGLVDTNGQIIIPIEYQMVGAINFLPGNIVEVTKDGKAGYFDIAKRELVVRTLYDYLIPYSRGLTIVKQDSLFGWLDNNLEYHSGFPSIQIEERVKSFGYLNEGIQLNTNHLAFCEVPLPEYAGNGILPIPAYLHKVGIFNPIEAGISTTAVPISGWSEYREVRGSYVERITDEISALITSFRERYIEGREEFYDDNRVTFLDTRLDTLQTARFHGQKLALRRLDSTLLEVRAEGNFSGVENDYDLTREYNYLAISPSGIIVQVPYGRFFPETMYARLDSSYLMGDFSVYDEESQAMRPEHFLSKQTITFMRDEILANYDFAFEEEEKRQQFEYYKGYEPLHASVDEIVTTMDELDRLNLDFLNKVLKAMEPPVL